VYVNNTTQNNTKSDVMGSVAEKHYLHRGGHELLERGCAVYNSYVDDDAFSCRTDLITVKASNVRRVTVSCRFSGIAGYFLIFLSQKSGFQVLPRWNPNCHFCRATAHSVVACIYCSQTVALVVAITLLIFCLLSCSLQLSSTMAENQNNVLSTGKFLT
jgi:hypothetical protein